MGLAHIGRGLLTVNGVPVAQLKSLRTSIRTGRKALKGMTPTGDPVGYVDGANEYEIDAEFYVPTTGESVDWKSVTNGVLVVQAAANPAQMEVYTGVFTMEVGGQYSEDDAYIRSVKLGATGHKESQ